MLSVEDVRSSYGRIEALHGVSINIAAGEIVTLLGANGAGKTTLIRAICGVQPISAGRIRFENRLLDDFPVHARVALGIAQVPEDSQRASYSPQAVDIAAKVLRGGEQTLLLLTGSALTEHGLKLAAQIAGEPDFVPPVRPDPPAPPPPRTLFDLLDAPA